MNEGVDAEEEKESANGVADLEGLPCEAKAKSEPLPLVLFKQVRDYVLDEKEARKFLKLCSSLQPADCLQGKSDSGENGHSQ